MSEDVTRRPPGRAAPRQYAPRVEAGERRRQVLEAAREIASARGFAAVSMEAIAKRLDVSRPVVYAASFANAHAVVEELIDREAAGIRERVAEWLPPRERLVADPEREVAEMARALARDVLAQPDRWGLLLAPAEWTATARCRVEALEDRLVDAVAAVVVEALGTEGAVDAPLVALSFVAGLKAVVLRVLSDPENHSADRIAAFGSGCARAVRAAGSAVRVDEDLRV